VPGQASAPLEPSSGKAEKAWHVQLASFQKTESAERESKRLQKSFGSLFAPTGGLKTVRARLPKGVFYRLGVGPMEGRAAATALCGKLKARGQACFVTRR